MILKRVGIVCGVILMGSVLLTVGVLAAGQRTPSVRLAFATQFPDNSVTSVVLVDAGRGLRVRAAEWEDTLAAFGRSGRDVLLLSQTVEQGIYATRLSYYDLATNRRVPLAQTTSTDSNIFFLTSVYLYYPNWSPDGEVVAYIADNELYLFDKSADAPQSLLTLDPDTALNMIWSPDSTQLAFSTADSVLIFNRADGSLRRFPLSERDANGYSAFWSSYSQHLIIRHSRDNGAPQPLTILNVPLGEFVAEASKHAGLYPRWSRWCSALDGAGITDYVAYTLVEGDAQTNTIYLLSLVTFEVINTREAFDGLPNIFEVYWLDEDCRWAVILAQSTNGELIIHAYERNTGTLHTLTNQGDSRGFFHGRLLFYDFSNTVPFRLFMAALDETLTITPLGELPEVGWWLYWSPDFRYGIGQATTPQGSQIVRYFPATGGMHTLLDVPPGYLEFAVWR